MAETKILEQRVLKNKKVILQTVQEIKDNGFKTTNNKIILPYLTDDELLARYRRIKPIISLNELFYYLKRYNISMLRNESYLLNVEKDIRGQVDMTGAETIAEFFCYHTYGHYGIFSPSIAEVLQQFPDDVLNDANAFYMTRSLETKYDLEMQLETADASCHLSRVKALVLKK